jgi:hypothetical protein
VSTHKIVVHIMQADRVSVVFDTLGKCIRQPSEPPHAHPHSEVLAFDVARRNVLRVRVAGAAERLGSLDLRGAIAACRMRDLAIELDQLGIIDIRAKAGLDCFQIGAMPICRDLDAPSESAGQITHKADCRCAAPIANEPRWNQLRIGTHRNPRPNVASSLRRGFGEHDVALLGIDEAPNLIELEPLARQITERLVLVCRARFAGIDQQFVDGIDRNVSDAACRAETVAFDQQIEDVSAFGDGQPVHRAQYRELRLFGQAYKSVCGQENALCGIRRHSARIVCPRVRQWQCGSKFEIVYLPFGIWAKNCAKPSGSS